MGTYVFILKQKSQHVLTKEIYYKHIEHLRHHKITGALFMAGPLKDQDRILQIIRANSMSDAEKIVQSDPYVSEGYYRSYEKYECIEANEQNNWLMDTPRIQEMLKNLP
jgi:uncharacterized protein YciI